ncbi:MAG TPA: ABC transporter permease [Candidatus Acidoferrales bacterium]
MRVIRAWLLRVAAIFRKEGRERELADEIEAHLRMHVEDNVRAGMTAEEARREALIKLGGIEQTKEAIRERRSFAWIESLIQDIRFALRMLRKNPGFTTVAVLTLALGIGANTAIFSAVNGIVLKPLPYADASQLVSIEGVRLYGSRMEATATFTPDVWNEMKKQTPAIAQMALYDDPSNVTLTGEAVPEIIPGASVSGDFFSVLGVQPLLGRPILATDTQPGAKPVVALSYELWHATWGADPAIIGRSVRLDNKDYEVVGVMPPDSIFPLNSFNRGGAKLLWFPLIVSAGDKPIDGMVVARLKPGVSIAAANAQLKTVSTHLSGDFKGLAAGGHFEARGLKRRFGDLDDEMLTLLGAVGFVLLIACVNVSGLLLARGWARQREVAVREALGASRLRIARQFLTESVLLAFAGGALGLLFSLWGVHILRAISPPNTQEHGQFRLDAHVLWFTAGVSLLTGILFGLAPAIQMSARRVGGALKENMGGSPGGYSARGTRKVRSALAIFEIAMAVVLVIGATLAARSFEKLTSIRLGFHTDHIMTMKANFSTATCKYAGAKLAPCRLAMSSVLSNMRAVPGVQSAAVASTLPLYPWSVALNVEIEGQTTKVSLASGEAVADRIVSTEYFRALGIPLLSGRDFLDSDTAGAEPISIVDDIFARKYLGDHPLGRRISYGNDAKGNPEWTQVVGVTKSVHDLNPGWDLQGEIYIPFAQATYFQGTNFIARTSQSPEAIVPALRRAIWSVDKNTPITDLATMDQLVSQSVAAPRYQTTLLAAFGGLGLVLAMVGVYGVISYGVSQRTREIGVRMALGAARGDVLRMVMREGMLLALGGIVAGVFGALALTRFLRSLLFEVKPTDPMTFFGVAIALMVVAMAACYAPARRAMRVDPMVALRHE